MLAQVTEITEITKLADKAASQDDRYLFILAILLFVGFLVWMVRFFIAKNETLHKEHRDTLSDLFAKSNDANVRMSVALERNTDVLNRIRDK